MWKVCIAVTLRRPCVAVNAHAWRTTKEVVILSDARIYLDNAATSFPKPPPVLEAMVDYANRLGASPGHGAYAESREAGRLIEQCRVRIARLIGADVERPEQIIFTLNTTDSLNMALRGVLREGDHVITTHLDHNSILRPLNALRQQAWIDQTRIVCDPQTGLVDPDDIRKAIRPNTKMIALQHASNVSGTMHDIHTIGAIAREHGVLMLLDAAQTTGHVPLNVKTDCIDLLACPGHKGLLGPLGTGVLYIRPGVEQQMQTVREGGTGTVSENDTQPDFLPDRFEAGSHNAIGIIALSAGVKWILEQTVEALWIHEQQLMQRMVRGLGELEAAHGLQWFGPKTIAHRCGVFSLRVPGVDPHDLSRLLEDDYGILTRSGLHCAPLAHKTFGTAESSGTTRFSFGPFNTMDQIGLTIDALGAVCRAHAGAGV
jgi:cysteine desulfurase family protein